MTTQKSFKTRIRERMDKTGESYTTARQQLIDKATSPNGSAPEDAQVIAVAGQRISDEALARRTDRAWDEWFELLDEWGAKERTHAEIARWLSNEHEVDGWWAQSITVGYEQARGMRKPGQTADGKFSASASKTVNVAAETAFDAFADDAKRGEWLPDVSINPTTVNSPKSYRAEWHDGTRIAVWLTPKGEDKTGISLQHEKIADADRAAELKGYWKERLNQLKKVLEG
ncbi:MAG: hypothetical protein EA415_01085 [Sphaerobacteraceae bacterium]|nr:MAG: hypothetical protein EA415_01085 [Sphaerobacteraceae bacterium]